MLYADDKGNLFSEEEVSLLSPSEIKDLGIHEYEENQDKRLFTFMDEMVN